MAYRYNSPPGWPPPPEGWTPPPGWQPDPSWGPAPAGWQFWVEEGASAGAPAAGVPSPGSGSDAPSESTAPGSGAPGSGAAPDATVIKPASDFGSESESAPGFGASSGGQPPSFGGSSGSSGPPTQAFGAPAGQPPAQGFGASSGGQPPGFGSSSGAPTQAFGAPAGQQYGGAQAQPGMYQYEPSAGLDQPGASPYAAGASGYGAAGGYGGPPGYGAGPGGPGPDAQAPKSKAPLIIGIIAAVVVLALVVAGAFALLGGSGDDDTTADPTVAPTTAEPTDDPTTAEPTDAPSDAPTTAAPTGDFVDLTGTTPALATGSNGDTLAEIVLLEAVPNWQPSGSSMLCSDPEEGQQRLGLHFQVTTTAAVADTTEGTYTFTGFELGALDDGNNELRVNPWGGLFCLEEGERIPSAIGPDEQVQGWIVLDAPPSAAAVTFSDWLDFTGTSPTYRWVLADQ